MKTETLRALEESLEDERRYLEAYGRLVSGQRREDHSRQRVRRITAMVASLRAEITARANPRNPGAAQRFDDDLQRALAIHLELEPANNTMQEHSAA